MLCTSHRQFQPWSRYLERFKLNLDELESRKGLTGKKVYERDHVEGAKRGGGLHGLTTPKHTNKILLVLGAIKLEYDLEMIRISVLSKKWCDRWGPTSDPLEIIMNEMAQSRAHELTLTFQAIPSGQLAGIREEGRWIHRVRPVVTIAKSKLQGRQLETQLILTCIMDIFNLPGILWLV